MKELYVLSQSYKRTKLWLTQTGCTNIETNWHKGVQETSPKLFFSRWETLHFSQLLIAQSSNHNVLDSKPLSSFAHQNRTNSNNYMGKLGRQKKYDQLSIYVARTLQIECVSNTRQVSIWHQHDTGTYDYIQSYLFSQIIINVYVSISILCPVFMSKSVLHRLSLQDPNQQGEVKVKTLTNRTNHKKDKGKNRN